MSNPDYYADLVRKELDSIFRILDTVEAKIEGYEFEFWSMERVKAITTSGTLPDQKYINSTQQPVTAKKRLWMNVTHVRAIP
ncbi:MULTISPECIES: hypothetical protein [Providencia]|uniref:Uncharacterized protein n=1 Tax=Providencia stuartii TaxID=588 RepID=A0AAI9HZX3_PROST|nr:MULTISPECIES: hypothetical protein [Providencia]ELR5043280.1 hypothetical protein [Providencia rettgeri]ELR5035167.1 hypothetical protein [Providencia stuartii]ELR5290455.1 hypothetical protein [Providencia stuartii]ELZ5938479.1 hypothetical protein [Providencia stuartii]MCR4178969.1 hypothetical protein [Providencia vermicola]